MVGYLEEDEDEDEEDKDEDDDDDNNNASQQVEESNGISNGNDSSSGIEETKGRLVEDGDKEDGTERGPSTAAASAASAEKKNRRFRIAGQAVMLMGTRGPALAGDPLVSSCFQDARTLHEVVQLRFT